MLKFPTQGSKLHLLHCKQILYHLSHKRSPNGTGEEVESENEVAQSCPTLCDPWTVAHQAPPSMGFSRQEYWSGLPFPSRTQVSHIAGRRFNLCTTREAKLPTETQNIKDVQERKGNQVERRRGRRREGGWCKRGGLIDVSCHLRMPRRYGTFPWASREGRTGTRPCQKSDQTRTRIRVLCQVEVISLQSSAQGEGPSTRFLRPGLGD